MNNIDELSLITGVDVPIPEIGITLHQPCVGEIAALGETSYLISLQSILLTPASLKIHCSDWELFQQVLQKTLDDGTKMSVLIENFLQLFFYNKVTILPSSLLLTGKQGVVSIEPNKWSLIQQAIHTVGGGDLLTPTKEKSKPINKKAAEILAKIEKGQQKLAKLKATNKPKSFLKQYITLVEVGLGYTPKEVNEFTIHQLITLSQLSINKEQYLIGMQARCFGASSDQEIVHWSTPQKD